MGRFLLTIQVFKRDLEEMEEYWDLNLIILNLLPLHFMIC